MAGGGTADKGADGIFTAFSTCPMPTGEHPIFSSRKSRTQRAGFSIVQVMVAMGVIIICGIAGVQALVHVNQKAAAMRLMANARAVVQRNLDTALCVPFSSTIQPAILAITGAGGVVF